MTATKHWTIDVIIGEDEGRTYAEARLHDEIDNSLVGLGRAWLHPSDHDVPEIGDEVAVARALNDLGHRLLITAAGDIAQVTGQHPTRLAGRS
jgi:hypothetical protein